MNMCYGEPKDSYVLVTFNLNLNLWPWELTLMAASKLCAGLERFYCYSCYFTIHCYSRLTIQWNNKASNWRSLITSPVLNHYPYSCWDKQTLIIRVLLAWAKWRLDGLNASWNRSISGMQSLL